MDRGDTMIKIIIARGNYNSKTAEAFKHIMRGEGYTTSPYHFYVDCNATITRLKDISTLNKDDELKIMVDCGKLKKISERQKKKLHRLLATVKARFKGDVQDYEKLLL